MLKPKIKADEEFEMTVEFDGHAYIFKGRLSDFNMECEQDWIESIGPDMWVQRIPTLRSYKLDMAIQVIGPVNRVQR